jgi:hypothetical protein
MPPKHDENEMRAATVVQKPTQNKREKENHFLLPP